MVERERAHLVISLGEGSDGQRVREVLDQQAKRAEKPVTTWARETLLRATEAVDPIVEVETRVTGDVGNFGPHYLKVFIDLRGVVGMRPMPEKGQFDKGASVEMLIGSEWLRYFCSDSVALTERWKQLKRGG